MLLCSGLASAAIPMWGSISITVLSGPTAPNGAHSVRSNASSHTGGPAYKVDELSLNLYLWRDWTFVDDDPKYFEDAWFITSTCYGSSAAGNVTWRAEAYANCLDYDLEDTGTWTGYAEWFVSYGRALTGTELDVQKRMSPGWEALYHDAIAECSAAGLNTYRWDALLNGTVTELSSNRAAALAWTYQSVKGFQAGDTYPLVAVQPDGRVATIQKVAWNHALTSRSFEWNEQAWIAQDE